MYKLVLLLISIFSFYHMSSVVYAQDTSTSQDSVKEFQATLEYGIDTSVIQVLKTLTQLEIASLKDMVLKRMQETQNTELIVEGFSYFRAIKDASAVEFALNTIENYVTLPRQSIQYATFYLKDNIASLTEAEKEDFKIILLDIVDTDNPAIVLSALELLPSLYTETDIEYTQDSAILDSLYSTQLQKRYQSTNVDTIKDQLIITMGEIQSYNQVEFLIEIAGSESTSQALRSSALESLAYFSSLSEELIEKRNAIYEQNRASEIPNIRMATLEALGIAINNSTQSIHEDYIIWLKNGLRDPDMSVRKVALESFYTFFKEETQNNVSSLSDSSLLSALEYMSKNDPEHEIQLLAMKVLGVYPDAQGVEFLLEDIKTITHLGTRSKNLINITIGELLENKRAEEAIIFLIKSNRDTRNSSIIQHIAEQLSISSTSQIEPLIDLLITHSDSAVLLACISAIGKHKLTKYLDTLSRIHSNITLSTEVRNKANQIINFLSESQ